MPEAGDGALFRIVQVEVPGAVDVQDGRWTVRGHANRPRAVVLVESTDRPRRRYLRRRADPDEDAQQPSTTLTVVDADPLEARDVDRWLARVDDQAVLTEALDILRHLLHLAAVAAADPDPRPLRARDLSRATVAYGTGPEGAYGRWTASRRLPVPADDRSGRRRGGPAASSDERLAELLSGRDAVLAAEVLTLRARQDLNAGRVREAALGLRMALEAAITELEPWRAAPQLDDAITALLDARPRVASAAAAAARGGLEEEQDADVRDVLKAVSFALARPAGGRRVGEREAPLPASRPRPSP
ncbi:hypothetical protein [Patulibacter minatonensis]|uniref:hypothetical protein n=1 Tax=Patulibacter minatonensis TaxID=298163 RepID=UPI00047BC5AD|nr:hypothetical protein [Patulibacter minatonensis]